MGAPVVGLMRTPTATSTPPTTKRTFDRFGRSATVRIVGLARAVGAAPRAVSSRSVPYGAERTEDDVVDGRGSKPAFARRPWSEDPGSARRRRCRRRVLAQLDPGQAGRDAGRARRVLAADRRHRRVQRLSLGDRSAGHDARCPSRHRARGVLRSEPRVLLRRRDEQQRRQRRPDRFAGTVPDRAVGAMLFAEFNDPGRWCSR